MFILLGFAFLSGLVTILAPCIWPLLPIVLSYSSSGKGYLKPLGVTLGIILSFALFTLSLSYLVKIFGLNVNVLRVVAVIIISFLGLTLLIPSLASRIESIVSKIGSLFGPSSPQPETGFWGGLITGLSLGMVWSPCAGPILAAIATLAATRQVSWQIILVTMVYVVGIGIPLFALAYGGRQIITKTRFISAYTGRIQQVFGAIMILTAVAIYTNYDKVIEAKLLNIFPQFGQALNKFESNSAVKQQLARLTGRSSNMTNSTKELFNENTHAPDLVGISQWLNTDKPLSIKDLKGKVVLVDFWTYTCINCIRTLPFVTNWYDKYRDQGLVVIGVHTPEFQFEHDADNVLRAIKQYNIHYPVALDNNYDTWNNFNNSYWPAEYLIDANGKIRRTHFGEGKYDEMEMAIQELLKEAGQQVSAGLAKIPEQTPTHNISPETYLGANRMAYYYPSGRIAEGEHVFKLAEHPPLNSFSYGGEWNIGGENAIAGANATLVYHFSANKVFLVLRSGTVGTTLGLSTSNCGQPEGCPYNKNAQIKVYLDGMLLNASNAGQDVVNGVVTVTADKLYNLIDLHGKYGDHILKLEFLNSGIEVFAFTFG